MASTVPAVRFPALPFLAPVAAGRFTSYATRAVSPKASRVPGSVNVTPSGTLTSVVGVADGDEDDEDDADEVAAESLADGSSPVARQPVSATAATSASTVPRGAGDAGLNTRGGARRTSRAPARDRPVPGASSPARGW